MSLSPEHVPWNFVTGTIVIINVGLVWLLFHDPVRAFFRRLWLSDGIACWLGFAAAYHGVKFVGQPRANLLGGLEGVWILAGALGAYLLMRLLPTPLRHPTWLLGAMLLCWAWSIGAGYDYLARLDADMALLRQSPSPVLQAPGAPPTALTRALHLPRVDEVTLELVRELVEPMRAGRKPAPEVVALAQAELVPRLLARYEEETSRLAAYQVFQLALAAAVLLAWGFGNPVRVPGPPR